MAGSSAWLRVACIVAGWAAVMSNIPGKTEQVKAKQHQNILLHCLTLCTGQVSFIVWFVFTDTWEHINDYSDKETHVNKYIKHDNHSLTIENPDWMGSRLHRCQWSCKSEVFFVDTDILIIKGVKMNKNMKARIGEHISIPCQTNSARQINGSVNWHVALQGQPYYPLSIDSMRTKYLKNRTTSLLINDVNGKDAGVYLCELTIPGEFYETRLDVIKGKSSTKRKNGPISPRPTTTEEPSHENLPAVYIGVTTLCTVIICLAVHYFWKKMKIRRSNTSDSASNNVNNVSNSGQIQTDNFCAIGPSETRPEADYSDSTFTDDDFSDTFPEMAEEEPYEETTMAPSAHDVHFAEVTIYW
ncbi:uncharacterized protein LOC144738579 isoform X2 [Lampetra planeri]